MVGDFCQAIESCTTLEGVREAFREEIARHGYTTSVCRFKSNGHGSGADYYIRDWPKDWAQLSDENNFARKSAVIAEARRRMVPFTWHDLIAGQALGPAAREVFDATAAWGWINGFVVPMHGPSGYFACVSMASPERDLDLSPSRRMHLHMIAVLTHERCHALTNSTPPDDPREVLSQRELECLRWVGAGKTDWEIGVILAISSATVRFDVDRARRKLDAATRPQAVARLMMRGLL